MRTRWMARFIVAYCGVSLFVTLAGAVVFGSDRLFQYNIYSLDSGLTSMVLLALHVGAVALGAILYAGGVERQYRSLLDDVSRLERGVRPDSADAGLFTELRQRLAGLYPAAPPSGGNARAREDAKALLAEAAGHLDVILEAGQLPGGGAAEALVRQAAEKVRAAEARIAENG